MHQDITDITFCLPHSGDSEREVEKEQEQAEQAEVTCDNRSGLVPPIPLRQRPGAVRSCTDPSPGTVNSQSTLLPSSSQRNRSPYSRTHSRSRSSGAVLSAPQMTRAHSSPAASRILESSLTLPVNTPTSPMKSPARQRSPFRLHEDSSYNPPPRSPGYFETASGSAIESIQEDRELSITPRHQLPQPLSAIQTPFSRSTSLRRRPASPLHHATTATSVSMTSTDHSAPTSAPIASSGSNSPSLGPQRYNEAFPPLHHYASSSSFSSISSTPTSQRSRSPSISSLDTIEDAPDLESEAIEAERIERLKLAAERAERAESTDEADDNPRRRGSLDVPKGFGFSRGGNRERKRWSVCGGERRADLDLETIWED